jgi:hypothetical protein
MAGPLTVGGACAIVAKFGGGQEGRWTVSIREIRSKNFLKNWRKRAERLRI